MQGTKCTSIKDKSVYVVSFVRHYSPLRSWNCLDRSRVLCSVPARTRCRTSFESPASLFLKDRPDVVRLLNTRRGAPADIVTIGENGNSKGGSVVSTHSNHHQSGLGSFSLSLEFVQRSGRLDYILSILDNDVGVAVRKFRRELVTERHVLRVDYNMVTPSSGRVNS